MLRKCSDDLYFYQLQLDSVDFTSLYLILKYISCDLFWESPPKRGL